MLTVLLEGLEVYAYHGVPAEERVVGHRYRIDLELLTSSAAAISDDVADTVDYGHAGLVATRIATESQFKTVERLAVAIGSSLLETFPQVEEVTVTVRKPFPPAPMIAAAAGARVTLRKGSAG